jgi:hypothetical protein
VLALELAEHVLLSDARAEKGLGIRAKGEDPRALISGQQSIHGARRCKLEAGCRSARSPSDRSRVRPPSVRRPFGVRSRPQISSASPRRPPLARDSLERSSNIMPKPRFTIMQRLTRSDYERILLDENADHVDRSKAIYYVAADHLEQYEPQIARMLDHDSAFLREEAVQALLAHWHRAMFVDKALHMLAHDPSPIPRRGAAFALGAYVLATGAHREVILPALARTVRYERDKIVVTEAYRALLRILVPERKIVLPDPIHRDRHVDWKLINPYLERSRRDSEA